jgi:hypothetical protein
LTFRSLGPRQLNCQDNKTSNKFDSQAASVRREVARPLFRKRFERLYGPSSPLALLSIAANKAERNNIIDTS